MKLRNLITNGDYGTDKDTTHSYIDFYEDFFAEYSEKEVTVLEIGTGCGGATELWHDYFLNGKIYGIEINKHDILTKLNEKERITIYQGTDCCSMDTVEMIRSQGLVFDIIIDDASHTLQSQIFSAKYWTELLNDDGLFVIEDVQHIDYCPKIIDSLPEKLKLSSKTEDRRSLKNRFDDILVTAKNNRRN